MDPAQLNRHSLRYFRSLFESLQIPDVNGLAGVHRGFFVGPAWVRILARPALFITGLGGWWGKEIFQDGTAVNIVFRHGKYSTCFPMYSRNQRSSLDGRQGPTLYYGMNNPILGLLIADEIRSLDESRLLGMTRPKIPGLGWLAFPFILQKQERQDSL